MDNENQSEVARLRAQIAVDYEAAQQAMNGFAVGAAHELITARMEHMSRAYDQLREIDEQAMLFLINTMEGKKGL